MERLWRLRPEPSHSAGQVLEPTPDLPPFWGRQAVRGRATRVSSTVPRARRRFGASVSRSAVFPRSVMGRGEQWGGPLVPFSPSAAARAPSTAGALVDASGHADLLVVGARRPAHAIGAPLGHVAHAVLHHARCSVAMVPCRGPRGEGG
ncbi:universal stress protein [Streptomyces krungchingensis]|uniref:universal stress protein n=1 Tax=Streptomyces krungchingensis TaxID=1565034 RepID=UPI003CFA9D11